MYFTGEVFDLRQAANSVNANHQVKSNGVHSKPVSALTHQNNTNSNTPELKRRARSVNEGATSSALGNNNSAQQQSKHQRNATQTSQRNNTAGK